MTGPIGIASPFERKHAATVYSCLSRFKAVDPRRFRILQRVRGLLWSASWPARHGLTGATEWEWGQLIETGYAGRRGSEDSSRLSTPHAVAAAARRTGAPTTIRRMISPDIGTYLACYSGLGQNGTYLD